MKQKGTLLSLVILLISLILVIRTEAFVKQVVGSGYHKVGQVEFNSNEDFKYRAQIFSAQNGFWVVDPQELIYVDKSGKIKWKKPLASQNIIVDNGIADLLICEKKAGDVFWLNSEGEIKAQLTSLGEIEKVRLFDDKFAGVLKTNGEFVIYNNQLKPLGQIVFTDEEVLDFKMTKDHERIVVSMIDLDSEVYNSKLLFYDTAGNSISGKIVNYFIFDYYIYEDKILAVTDSTVTSFDYEGATIESQQVVGSISQFLFDEDSSKVIIQTYNDPSDLINPMIGRQIQSYNSYNEPINLFETPMNDTKGIVGIEDGMIFYNEGQWLVLNSEGKVVFEGKASEVIQNIHVVSKDSYAVEYINKIDIYNRK